MEQKTLLITGFEPFQQETINPSWEAVALLPETIGLWRLEKLRLPVVFGKAADLAIARAQQLCPQAILAVGQAGGRGAVTPELVASSLNRISRSLQMVRNLFATTSLTVIKITSRKL